MTILNAHNAHNSSTDQNVRRGAGADASQLALAVAIARDGIVGAEDIDPAKGRHPIMSPFQRLENLDADFALAVLAAEMLEGITVRSDGTDPANWAQIDLRGPDDRKQRLFNLKAPDEALLHRQLDLIIGYADLRLERLPEILTQRDSLLPFFAPLLPFLGASQTSRMGMLLALTDQIVTSVVQRVKLLIACRRPMLFTDRVQPMIDTPTHGSYPSGHATQAFAMATVLSAVREAKLQQQESQDDGQPPAPGDQTPHTSPVVPTEDNQLFRMAARIAANRTVAGVHYPIDSASGALLGLTIGNALLARLGAFGDGWVQVPAISFDADAWHPVSGDDGGGDFYLARLVGALDYAGLIVPLPPVTTRQVPMGAALWRAVTNEWRRRWG